MAEERSAPGRARRGVSTAFSHVQDVVYVALGALLAVSATAILVQGALDLFKAVTSGVDVRAVVTLLDRILLALMIVELLYTVQVSFREHTLVPEPFLLVALIAGVRRILVITAEFGAQPRMPDEEFRHVMAELALLTVLIVVLVASIVILKRHGPEEGPRSHAG
ncbi:phosphate-starvation-inducible PsiE family protein [Anaeromyxobacter oryzae]|uniref:Protein PsiE n=1 Tax=Anaeromyxobacter oryzae TaxID=2918170 RepID=A0ABM7WRS3_9BACT|nr:phosphate-starvation-inducible PsiE family protein [Anaeromyxobacter oryzae]BDG02146.1 hypothetical protein AMOR_11420 [Anaeromyxobacter oryzae]